VTGSAYQIKYVYVYPFSNKNCINIIYGFKSFVFVPQAPHIDSFLNSSFAAKQLRIIVHQNKILYNGANNLEYCFKNFPLAAEVYYLNFLSMDSRVQNHK
jgi:hypothetical protein